MQRFYDPNSGAIFVNGLNLKSLNLRKYRSKIGYVGQEPVLFNQSIKDNMLNAKPDATDEEIIDALKASMAYEFVERLQNGINSEVGSIGSKLSGGQKQRIAIARALLRKPEILILDEATSALDKVNEKKVQEAINHIRETYDMTIIVIAHRLSTIKDADIIHVLDKGEVLESGNHEELMKANSSYANFFKAQTDINIPDSIPDLTSNSPELHSSASESTRLTSDSFESNSLDLNPKNSSENLSSPQIFYRLLGYNKPAILILISIFGCIYIACSFVCISIPQSKMMFGVVLNFDGKSKLREIIKYSEILSILGITAMIMQWVTRSSLTILSQNMTRKIRKEAYENIIHQPIEFFDKKENATGALTSTLSADMKAINGAAVESYVYVFQSFVALGASVVVAFIFCTKIGIVNLCYIPLMAIAAKYQINTIITMPSQMRSKTDEERILISESIMNNITVASL